MAQELSPETTSFIHTHTDKEQKSLHIQGPACVIQDRTGHCILSKKVRERNRCFSLKKTKMSWPLCTKQKGWLDYGPEKRMLRMDN